MTGIPVTTIEPGQDVPASGWRASLSLSFEPRGGRTVLARQRRQGPLTVQRAFYPEGGVCHLYLLHPPGGVVGGDRLEVSVDLAPGAHALLTAPGATKFYRSAGPRAIQTQRLQVAAGAALEWLPNEAILFPGASLRGGMRVELDHGARFIGWEVLCLGRPVIGERFTAGAVDLALSLSRGGRPLLAERLRIATAAALDAPTGLRGFPVSATLLATGAGADEVAAARAALSPESSLLTGVTRVDDLLIVRCLGHAVEPVQRTLRALWGILRPRLLGVAACPPRIWGT